jgi:hypothetical protein
VTTRRHPGGVHARGALLAAVDRLTELDVDGGDELLQPDGGVFDVLGVAFELELDEVAGIDNVVEGDLDLGQFPFFTGLVHGDQRPEVQGCQQLDSMAIFDHYASRSLALAPGPG